MIVDLPGVRITSIFEREVGDMSYLLPEATPAALSAIDWLQPAYLNEAGEPRGDIQALVVEVDDQVVLVDCCIGEDKDIPLSPEWSTERTGFIARLQQAGFDPEHIDMVLSTHLHLDHVGWNTTKRDGQWVPTFPNARYVFSRVEYERWRDAEQMPPVRQAADPEIVWQLRLAFQATQVHSFVESVRPIAEAGLAEIVDLPFRVAPRIQVVATPGHTAGHTSIAIQTGDGTPDVFICGDAFHHPSQIAHPEWAAQSDDDSAQSTETRCRLLWELADSDTIFIGTHFAEPASGQISSLPGGGYRFVTNGTTGLFVVA